MAECVHAMLNHPDEAIVGIYAVVMIVVGAWFGRRRQDAEGYLLADRSMGWWLAGISCVMTLVSTLSIVAIPGEAYNHGITLALQNLILPPIAVAAFCLFVPFYFKTRMYTPFDYLEKRFSPKLRGIAAGFYWLTRIIYLGLVTYATSVILQGACGWPKHWTIILAGAVAAAYTLLGGLRAVAWTDLLQFIVLAGGMLALLAKVLAGVPEGVVGAIHYAFEHGRGMPQLRDASFYSASPFVRLTLWGLVLYLINEQLFFNSADQITIQRYLSTSGYRQARRSLLTFVVLSLPVTLSLWFLGLAIFTFYSQQAPGVRPGQGDLALYQFISTQLPTPLRGLMIAALLGKGISTLAGGLSSLATVATVDGYHRFISRNASQESQVAFSRLMTLLVAAISVTGGLALSWLSDAMGTTVIETSLVWLSLWMALPPVFLLGVLSRRARAWHAMVALLLGVLTTSAMIVWHLISQGTQHPLSFLYVGIPGPALALVVAVLLSRLSPRLESTRLADLTFYTTGIAQTEPAARGHSLPGNFNTQIE